MRTTTRRVRIRHRAAALAALALTLTITSCTGSDSGAGPVPSGPTTIFSAAPDPGAVTTRASIGVVAGRVGAAQRRRIKKVATRVVDGYLDGAYAGSYPRTDFSAAFTDFRTEARRDAERDLSLLTNADVGAQLASVTPTQRRLRVDVLAPGGRMSAATARFVLDYDTAGAQTRSMRVSGSLLLSNQRGAWKVFGYHVRPEVRR